MKKSGLVLVLSAMVTCSTSLAQNSAVEWIGTEENDVELFLEKGVCWTHNGVSDSQHFMSEDIINYVMSTGWKLGDGGYYVPLENEKHASLYSSSCLTELYYHKRRIISLASVLLNTVPPKATEYPVYYWTMENGQKKWHTVMERYHGRLYDTETTTKEMLDLGISGGAEWDCNYTNYFDWIESWGDVNQWNPFGRSAVPSDTQWFQGELFPYRIWGQILDNIQFTPDILLALYPESASYTYAESVLRDHVLRGINNSLNGRNMAPGFVGGYKGALVKTKKAYIEIRQAEQAAIETELESSYADGYSFGQMLGYDSGYQLGKTDGYDIGYADGAAEGQLNYNSGYDNGYHDGYADGRSDAGLLPLLPEGKDGRPDWVQAVLDKHLEVVLNTNSGVDGLLTLVRYFENPELYPLTATELKLIKKTAKIKAFKQTAPDSVWAYSLSSGKFTVKATLNRGTVPDFTADRWWPMEVLISGEIQNGETITKKFTRTKTKTTAGLTGTITLVKDKNGVAKLSSFTASITAP